MTALLPPNSMNTYDTVWEICYAILYLNHPYAPSTATRHIYPEYYRNAIRQCHAVPIPTRLRDPYYPILVAVA